MILANMAENLMLMGVGFMVVICVQLIVNVIQKPYVICDFPDLASVYIYRLGRGSSGYSEYKFMKRDGKWKEVIDKVPIIFIAILWAIIFLLCFLEHGDFWGCVEVFIPIGIMGAAILGLAHLEAYMMLINELRE